MQEPGYLQNSGPQDDGRDQKESEASRRGGRSPKSKPPTIVTPEREQPGSRAMDRIRPTKSAAFQISSSRGRQPR